MPMPGFPNYPKEYQGRVEERAQALAMSDLITGEWKPVQEVISQLNMRYPGTHHFNIPALGSESTIYLFEMLEKAGCQLEYNREAPGDARVKKQTMA